MSDAINTNNNPNLDSVNPNDMIEIGHVSDSVMEQQQPKPPQQQPQKEQMVSIPVSEYQKYLGSSGTILVNRIKTDNELDDHIVNLLNEVQNLLQMKKKIKKLALIPGEEDSK